MSADTPHTRWDADRPDRIGLPEAILCSHKTAEQIADSLRARNSEGQRVLLTRLDPATFAALPADLRVRVDYHPLSRTGLMGQPTAAPPVRTTPADAPVAIVTAGTSDLGVGLEAQRTLLHLGIDSEVIADVGVAGLHRVLEQTERLAAATVVIVVAGMEGALFSVIAGLVRGPIIAVPASPGYGVTHGGYAALISALGSCAPGVVVCNIDNGYGAACATARILSAVEERLLQAHQSRT